jgi:hypothetical protein
MTRRRIFCGLLLASAVLTCSVGWLWTASRPRSMRARFDQVKKGMSRDEVIRILGGPPGDYTDGQWSPMPRMPDDEAYQSWISDEGELLVRFDDADRATDVAIHSVFRGDFSLGRPPTFTERIRRWLGL